MSKKKAQPQLPAWVWLFTGIMTGLFAAFLVYLANVKGTPTESTPPARAPQNTTSAAGQVSGAKPVAPYARGTSEGGTAMSGNTATERLSPEDRARRFEFYTLLPEAETLGVPTEEEKAATAATTNGKPDAGKPEETKTANVPKQRTLLQTGSFQRAQDAEKLRAQIILLGLPASIQKVEVRPGETWHRVQAGPFTDAAALANAQKTLKDARVQHIVIRMKNP